VSFGYDLQVAFEKIMPILMSEYALWQKAAIGKFSKCGEIVRKVKYGSAKLRAHRAI